MKKEERNEKRESVVVHPGDLVYNGMNWNYGWKRGIICE
jgi:hypothetical protein